MRAIFESERLECSHISSQALPPIDVISPCETREISGMHVSCPQPYLSTAKRVSATARQWKKKKNEEETCNFFLLQTQIGPRACGSETFTFKGCIAARDKGLYIEIALARAKQQLFSADFFLSRRGAKLPARSAVEWGEKKKGKGRKTFFLRALLLRIIAAAAHKYKPRALSHTPLSLFMIYIFLYKFFPFRLCYTQTHSDRSKQQQQRFLSGEATNKRERQCVPYRRPECAAFSTW